MSKIHPIKLKIINELIEILKKECSEKEHLHQIEENIISPLIDYISEKVKPYIFLTSIFFIITIILIITIMYILILKLCI